MSAPIVLLILRFVSAGLLLAFLGGISWALVKEMRVTAESLDSHELTYGSVVVHSAESDIERFPLRAVTSIGRTPTNNIIIDNTYTSSQHALISLRAGQWWLEDLESRNGTRVNDIEISNPVVISTGDAIEIGAVTLKLEL